MAATYRGLALAQRDVHHNGAALYNLLAARSFEPVDGPGSKQAKRLIRRQIKHLVGYAGFDLVLALATFLLLSIFIDGMIVRLCATAMSFVAFRPLYMAYFDGLFSLVIARWTDGASATRWPSPRPLETIVLDNAGRLFRECVAKP